MNYQRVSSLQSKKQFAEYVLCFVSISLAACLSVAPSLAQSFWYPAQDGKVFSGPAKFPADVNREVQRQMAAEREHVQFLEDPYKCFALMNLYKTYKPKPLSESRRAQAKTLVNFLDLNGFASNKDIEKDMVSMLDAVAAIKDGGNDNDFLLAHCYIQLARLLQNLPTQNQYRPQDMYGFDPISKSEKRAEFSVEDKAYCLKEANILLDKGLRLLNVGNPEYLNQLAEIYELKALQDSDLNEAYSTDSWELAVKARLDAVPRNDGALVIDIRRLLDAYRVANLSSETTDVLVDLNEIFVAEERQSRGKQFEMLFAPSALEAKLLAECPISGSSAWHMYLLSKVNRVFARSIVRPSIGHTSLPRVTYGLFGTKQGIENTQAAFYINPLREPGAAGLSTKVSKQTMDLYESTFLVSNDVRRRESAMRVQELLDRQTAYRQEEQRKADRLNYLLGRLQKLLSFAPINK